MSLFSASNLSAIPELGFVLGIMVLVHEFGHFAAAKLCKVRVEAFAIGFGRKLFGFESGGTSYQVNILPLGGYVKMAGELPGETHNSDDPGEFQNHPRWQRTLIAVAGPIANFILAFILMAGLYMADDEVPAYFTQPGIADYVSPSSVIGRTGMRTGDRVVLFDDQENPTWQDLEQRGQADMGQTQPFAYLHEGKRVSTSITIDEKGRPEDFEFEKLGLVPIEQNEPVQVQHPHSVAALLAYLQDRAGKPSVVDMQRSGPNGQPTQLNIPIVPFLGDGQHGKQWMLGFKPVQPPVTVVQLPFSKAIEASWTDNVKNSRLIFDVLGRLLTRQVSVKSLSSPVGMSVQVHEAFELPGWFPIIATMAMISLNLGIFNLLPIPILDGGMILFLAIESLIRRDLNQNIKERVYKVAFVCLVLFAAVVIFNDITRYLPTHLKT